MSHPVTVSPKKAYFKLHSPRAMDPTSPIRAHMAPFSIPNPFRSAYCLNHGEQTPPSSPESQKSGHNLKEGRLPLSRFFKKAPPSRSALSRAPSVKVWRDTKALQDVLAHPLHFLVPVSPPPTEDGSLPDSRGLTPELRRRSCSYTDLTAAAQQQQEIKTSRITTPLLPSPLEPEGPPNLSPSYFDFKNPKPEAISSPEIDNETYISYEDLRILSCYYGDSSRRLQTFEEESVEDDEGTDYYDEPRLPDRSTIFSVESDWFADTKSYEERLSRFRQRCFQVVQHPMSNDITIREDGGYEIKLATVLVGPGKPKIVQIHRPPSSMSTFTASESSLNIPATSGRPETPIQMIREISAFSPYDTPPRHPESLMLSDTPIRRKKHPRLSNSTIQNLIPAPLSIPSYHSVPRVDSAVSMDLSHHRSPDSFTTSATSASIHQALPSTSHEIQTSLRCWKLERTIDSIAAAIEFFPNKILRLDSDPIHDLRHSNITDQIHISCLQKVFPRASPLLLSALAAWLIVDLYFAGLDLDSRASARNLAAVSNESLHRIPAKARVTLGIRVPETDVEPESGGISLQEKALRNQARLVWTGVAVIGQRLMEALRGCWDEDLWRALRVLIGVVEAGDGRMV